MNRYHYIQDFHAERARGVGASDRVTLAGFNIRYFNWYQWAADGKKEKLPQTTRTLWLEKRGLVVQIPDPDPLKEQKKLWGNLQEGLILREWVLRRTDEKEANTFYAYYLRGKSWGPYRVKTGCVHPDRSYCRSHADLLWDPSKAPASFEVMPDPEIVEAKATGVYAAKRREGLIFEGWDDNDFSQMGTPDKVFVQTQSQAYDYGVEKVTACVLIEGNQYREYGPIIYDPRHVEKSLALAESFWSLVESNTEPTPATWGDVVSLYQDLENKTAMISGEAEMSARKIIEEGREAKERIKALEAKIEDGKMALGILAGDVRQEDGTIKRTMNRVLNDSNGETLATFRDQTKDSLSLSPWLTEIEKKRSKRATQEKRLAEGKPVDPKKWEESTLSEEEERILKLEADLRALGAYKTSEPFRVVNY